MRKLPGSTCLYKCILKAWEKLVSAGRTCRLEKCGFNSKDHAEFEVHLLKHKEDLKKRLICNQVGLLAAAFHFVFFFNCLTSAEFKSQAFHTQEGCGAQMKNQKAWQEHVEGHKAKLKANIINSVR